MLKFTLIGLNFCLFAFKSFSQIQDCNVDSVIIAQKLVIETKRKTGTIEAHASYVKREINCSELSMILQRRSINEYVKLELDSNWEVLIYPCNNCENK